MKHPVSGFFLCIFRNFLCIFHLARGTPKSSNIQLKFVVVSNLIYSNGKTSLLNTENNFLKIWSTLGGHVLLCHTTYLLHIITTYIILHIIICPTISYYVILSPIMSWYVLLCPVHCILTLIVIIFSQEHYYLWTKRTESTLCSYRNTLKL